MPHHAAGLGVRRRVLSGQHAAYFWARGYEHGGPARLGRRSARIGTAGGAMSPATVVSELRSSADDLGKPGNDDTYGAGRVNAFAAVN
jgi:lantibiotic leader peptide-processing serine protease